jgi:hypothetical protein
LSTSFLLVASVLSSALGFLSSLSTSFLLMASVSSTALGIHCSVDQTMGHQ